MWGFSVRFGEGLPIELQQIFKSLYPESHAENDNYNTIPVEIGRLLAAWLAAWVFSQAVRVSAS